MSDFDTLVNTMAAFMRKQLLVNNHKPNGNEETFGDLLLCLHSERLEFLQELSNPDSTPNSIWEEAADFCNRIAMVSDSAVRRKFEAAEKKDQAAKVP